MSSHLTAKSVPITGQDLLPFFRDYWLLLEPARPRVYRALGWIVTVQLVALAEPYMFKHVLDAVVQGGAAAQEKIKALLVIMAAVLTSAGAIVAVKNLRIVQAIADVEFSLPMKCGRKLLRLPLVYHQSENTGLVVSKIIKGAGKLCDMTGLLLFEIVPLVIQIGVATVVFIVFSWRAMLVMLPILALFSALTWRSKIAMAPVRADRHAIDGQADELVTQAIINVMTTQAFAQEEREMRLIEILRERVKANLEIEYKTYLRADILRNGVVSIGRVGMIYVLARLVGVELSPGDLVFMITLAERIFTSCYRMGAVFDRTMEALEPSRRMIEILAEQETVADPQRPLAAPARFAGAIAFQDVSYAYKKREPGAVRPPVLKGLSLSVAPGQKLGVVGPSGGGKTTLAKLIERFDDPDTGAVTIDGTDLRLLRKADLRRQIGYVPQEVEIYDMTVAENIAYGRPEATREDIVRAAKAANAHDFVSELEHGYDELVGNRGLRLSGGQRQRVGIARALLLDPPILILDEATSNVDSLSEREITGAMREFGKGRTVIVIAHKLATIKDADRIVVIDGGAIVESGAHDELIGRKGLYQRLVELQNLDASL